MNKVEVSRGISAMGSATSPKILLPALAGLLLLLPCSSGEAQQGPQQASAVKQSVQADLERLTSAVAEAQVQLEMSQKQILDLRNQIVQLQSRLSATGNEAESTPTGSVGAQPATERDLSAKVEDLRERQDLQQAEIATHERLKVETESKFPVKLTGLILLNAFVNTRAVDQIQAPTLAIGGSGATGATLRQTVLGLDATGPHIFGGTTHADIRVDFFGSAAQSSYGVNAGLLRLRTAHATLEWGKTQARVELDRPILSPNVPTSLTAVAEPALAWSGNLWTWAPQVSVAQNFALGERSRLKVEAALIDVPDPPLIGAPVTANASLAEGSRWPGTEARVAFASTKEQGGAEIGFGGYFSPHRLGPGSGFNAWAGTIDYRIPLPARLELTGSLYRGLALGGLGGGGYKDYVYLIRGNKYYFRALSDVGGWTQIKARVSERVQLNAAFGIDNPFAGELRLYAAANGNTYQNLARNKTVFTNVIYSPSASTLFSLEYRRIGSAAVTGERYNTDVIGVAAGYKF